MTRLNSAAERGDRLQDDKNYMENIDWESCHSKYQDILDKYKEMYPTAEVDVYVELLHKDCIEIV